MSIEADKFNKFLFDRNHSTNISFEDYIKYLKEYVNNDDLVDKSTKQRFEVTISYLLSIMDEFEIDYKNKYVIISNEIKSCPQCNDILVEHPIISGSDGTGGYGLFCESCGWPKKVKMEL